MRRSVGGHIGGIVISSVVEIRVMIWSECYIFYFCIGNTYGLGVNASLNAVCRCSDVVGIPCLRGGGFIILIGEE